MPSCQLIAGFFRKFLSLVDVGEFHGTRHGAVPFGAVHIENHFNLQIALDPFQDRRFNMRAVFGGRVRLGPEFNAREFHTLGIQKVAERYAQCLGECHHHS